MRTSKLVDFHRRLIVPDGVYATGKKYAYLYGASARLLLYIHLLFYRYNIGFYITIYNTSCMHTCMCVHLHVHFWGDTKNEYTRETRPYYEKQLTYV